MGQFWYWISFFSSRCWGLRSCNCSWKQGAVWIWDGIQFGDASSAAAIHFLDSKGDRSDGHFVMTHMTHDQLASGKLPVMWCCTVHEAQQAPYTWWAQLWVASSTVMANKSCSSLADASSLHLEAADVASYTRRERASFATRGKLWKLWTGVTFSGRNGDKIGLPYNTKHDCF